MEVDAVRVDLGHRGHPLYRPEALIPWHMARLDVERALIPPALVGDFDRIKEVLEVK